MKKVFLLTIFILATLFITNNPVFGRTDCQQGYHWSNWYGECVINGTPEPETGCDVSADCPSGYECAGDIIGGQGACVEQNDPLPTATPSQCITRNLVSSSVTAGANNTTVVSCDYGLAHLDCINAGAKVGNTPASCTFSSWSGNNALFNCNVARSNVTSAECGTFTGVGSTANCCVTSTSILAVATSTPVPGATCPWSAPISISTLPSGSSGAIEGQADVIFPNNTQLLQSIYRGNQGYWRLVPVSGGNPQWGSAGAWSAPIAASTLPGSGTVQARSDYMIGNGANLVQALWRGDQGFTRTVPISGGVPVWANAGAWSAPIALSTLPGSGAVQAQADVIFPNNTQLLQSIYRGNQGYWRLVPVSGGNPQWGSAGAWSAPIAASTLPGSGTVQARSDYMIGNGANLVQALWRGDQGFTRTVPISGGVPQWSCASGPSIPTATPRPGTPTPTPNVLCVCGATGACSNQCTFSKYTGVTGITYSTPIKCSSVASLYPVAATAAQKTDWCRRPNRTKGDINGDDKVTITDYFYFVQARFGGKLPATINADFNGDGLVNNVDRLIIVNRLVTGQ